MQYPETKKIVELWKALPRDKRLELLRQLEDLVELEDLMDLDINDISTTLIRRESIPSIQRRRTHTGHFNLLANDYYRLLQRGKLYNHSL